MDFDCETWLRLRFFPEEKEAERGISDKERSRGSWMVATKESACFGRICLSLVHMRHQEIPVCISFSLSAWATVTKCHTLGGLSKRHLFVMVLEAGKSRSRCQLIGSLVRTLFLPHTKPPLSVSAHGAAG